MTHKRDQLTAFFKSYPHFIPALIVGVSAFLRLIYPLDLEFKLDEAYMWDRVHGVLTGQEQWPLLGMPSGVSVRNPGMSIWVFIALGWILKQFAFIHPLVFSPVGLSLFVGVLNALAIFLLIKLMGTKTKTQWIAWSLAALYACNPLGVLMQRKIWAQSLLPLFCVALLFFWKNRAHARSAFFWGVTGCLMGQIHMSGFFFAPALALTQLSLDLKLKTNAFLKWVKYWLLGSLVASIPLVPWLMHIFSNSSANPKTRGWEEAIQLKYWVFGLTNPFGLHLGNTLGVNLGPKPWHQMSDFLRNDAMALTQGIVLLLIAASLLKIVYDRFTSHSIPNPSGTKWAPFQEFYKEWRAPILTAGIVYGTLLTLTFVAVRRYYLVITFPFEGLIPILLFFAAIKEVRATQKAIVVLCVSMALLTVGALHYVHMNEGALSGDFGPSYNQRIKSKTQP